MNLSSMDYFITLTQEQSFTRAAERLHITQQALSAHIAGMEQELGSQLLLRRVPLELTYAGQVFLRYAQEIQRNLDSMDREFSDLAQAQAGVLRIGVSTTRSHAVMPLLIAPFQRQYPKISIQLAEGPNDALSERLTHGEIDLAIANFPEAVPGMELVDFYEEEVVLLLAGELWNALAGENAQALSAAVEQGDLTPLRDCPFLLNQRRDIAGRLASQLLTQAGIIPIPKVESNNMETLLELCAQGAGACFCPENLMRMTLSPAQQNALKIFHFQDHTRYQIRFGYLKQPHLWSVISHFISFARQSAHLL